ncbi:hypothetical protein [Alicyclobacillus fructus]|uniref:hypothetical protein n=1 Tax=Alicyclobacillus fructus TaxID=2816082 RepID=UPI001A8C3745|nr:hypothetical protein [Alicyclobacillus fructus]
MDVTRKVVSHLADSTSRPLTGTGPGPVAQSPPVTLPLRYMAVGLVCFLLFACDLAWQVNRGVLFSPGAPAGVTLTHLLTLGGLMSFVMGAVYQLSTVAFLVPIASVRWARVLFYAHVVGLVGFLASFAAWWPAGIVIFGAWMAAVLYGFCGNMMVSLLRARDRGPMWRFVFFAHLHLALALAAAVTLILGDANLWPAAQAEQMAILATHILLAGGGFFGFLIFGFSYKLVPMFTLSHGYDTRYEQWAFWASLFALYALVVWSWAPSLAIGLVSALGVVAAFLTHALAVRQILKRRVRRRVEAPIRGVLAALALGVLWAMGFAWHVTSFRDAAIWRGLVPFALLGFVSLTVVSLAYKIVPFLAWTRRFAGTKRTGSSVLISHLLDVSSARFVIGGMALGATGVGLGAPFGAAWLCEAGAWMVAASLGVFAFHMSSVFRRAARKEGKV